MSQEINSALTLVVGGTGSLGAEISKRLVSENHRVVIAARSSATGATLIQAINSNYTGNTYPPVFLPVDVSKDNDVRDFVDEVHKLGASMRLLVFLPAAPTGGGITTASVDSIVASVNVKVGGLLRLTRGLESLFTSESAIVVIGGNLGYDPIPHAATSGIANAALANTVRQLQFPLGEMGVRIHVVAPGPVDTKRWWQLAETEADKRGIEPQEILRESATQSSLKRLTTTAEVAWAVSVLADPLAASMTGGTLILDAGRRVASP